MAGKETKSHKVANPRKPRVVANPKVLNRTGGGTPPSQTVNNATRIAGIKKAFVAAAAKLESSDKLLNHVRHTLGLTTTIFPLTLKEEMRLSQVINFAKEQVPDWAKLPPEHRPGLTIITVTKQPRKRQHGLTAPKPRTSSRIVGWSNGTGTMTLPTNRDVSSLLRVAHVTRSAS